MKKMALPSGFGLHRTHCGSLLIAIVLGLGSVSAWSAPVSMEPMDAKNLKAKIESVAGPKLALVNLWASWCEPCKSEMPELVKLRRQRISQGLELYLVSGDSESDLKNASQVLAHAEVDFPTYHLKEAPDEFMKTFVHGWPAIVPTTLLVQKNGKVEAHWYGRIKLPELNRKIDEVLKRVSEQSTAQPKAPVASGKKVRSD